ncbi:transferrin-binding protein 2 [Rodentibacter mrazii]|uniref:Transferrin-binding protein 2 n=1 Tax=Rodentibacter mrazii TaxID=1908257 RepID=A0A1V3IE20_9PAST|nr:Slam-dependent surface lipoprotein [Rodentibacter mrazii]OOF38815.1 transferrin-binding protein 2 [Rodentibacter mrazii]
MTLTKNTLIKFGLTTFAALMISACGSSSGGSSSDNPPQQNNASNNTQTSQPTNNSQTNQKPNNQAQQVRNGTGATLIITEQDDDVKVRTATLNGYNTTSINVDGTNITIGFPNINAGSWTNIGDIKVCCGRYSDIRFGVSDPLDENSSNYMFYNGNPTKNMPTSGVATYSGESIISAAVQVLDDTDYYIGSSKFNVDFGNKTLNGALEVQNIQPININARISGNTFSGTANSASLPSSGNVEGKFYGNSAKEMAGLAQGNDESWGAAFGAQKK